MVKAKQIPEVLAANSSLRVIDIDPQVDLRWQAMVGSVPAIPDPIYHPTWLKILAEVFGSRPRHLACEDNDGQVVGILPLFYRRGWRRGCNFSSVFTGPLARNDQVRTALVRAAIERTRSEKGAHLHLKVMSNAADGLAEDVTVQPAYETYTLALPERPELLHFNSSIKRAINKATRSGVQVRRAQDEGDLRAWYRLYLQTMRKLLALPLPFRYFQMAWRELYSRGGLRLLLAEQLDAGHRKLLGGILILLYGQTVSFASAGWQEEEQGLRANDLLHWQAIQDACAEGFGWYDFGDVDLGNEGLARYKGKWGSEATIVYDYIYPASNNAMHDAHDKSNKPTQRLLQAVWPRLPLSAISLMSDCYYLLHL
jgi:hypothetical protein